MSLHVSLPVSLCYQISSLLLISGCNKCLLHNSHSQSTGGDQVSRFQGAQLPTSSTVLTFCTIGCVHLELNHQANAIYLELERMGESFEPLLRTCHSLTLPSLHAHSQAFRHG